MYCNACISNSLLLPQGELVREKPNYIDRLKEKERIRKLGERIKDREREKKERRKWKKRGGVREGKEVRENERKEIGREKGRKWRRSIRKKGKQQRKIQVKIKKRKYCHFVLSAQFHPKEDNCWFKDYWVRLLFFRPLPVIEREGPIIYFPRESGRQLYLYVISREF